MYPKKKINGKLHIILQEYIMFYPMVNFGPFNNSLKIILGPISLTMCIISFYVTYMIIT
jgi:hypothetical protein